MKRCICLLLLACSGGGAETPPPEPVTVGGEGTTEVEVEVEVARDAPGIARALGPTATFADLVAAIRRLDDRGEGSSDERCLVRGGARSGDGFRFEADVAVPLRPLPDAAPNVAARLRGRGPVRLLAVWGQRGSGSLVLAVVTTTSPRRGREAVLVVSEDGARVRFTDGEVSEALAGPHSPEGLAAWLGSEDGDAGIGRVVVTADAGVTLARLRRTLAGLPPRIEVAFAVALADDVRLPETPPPPSDDVGLCDREPIPEDGEGELDVAALRAAIGAKHDAFAECLSRAAPERAHGGRLGLRFRVAASGAVDAACATVDGIGDPAVRACVLGVLREVQVDPAPTGGAVLVQLPLGLVPSDDDRTRALCD
ncbi:MAG: hypothetical protein H6720_16885 [Sandaracinus sp.]|nr:hypothetical protein [Sandaracinus sp.]